MAAGALFTNILKLTAENRDLGLRQWLQRWKMAIRTGRGEKKWSGRWILREGHWETRQLPGKEWKKQPVTSEGEFIWQQKGTCVTEFRGLPKCEVLRVQYRKGPRGTSQQMEGMWKKSKKNFTCSHYESNPEGQGRTPGLENKRVIPSPSQLAAHHVGFVHLKCVSLGCCCCAISFSALQNYIQATLCKYIFKSLRSNQFLCTWCEILSVI